MLSVYVIQIVQKKKGPANLQHNTLDVSSGELGGQTKHPVLDNGCGDG